MRTWDIIEEVLSSQPVSLRLERREIMVVREAHAAWVRRTLDEASAWDVLEKIQMLAEADTTLKKVVKGLDPRETQIVKHISRWEKPVVKQGERGDIVALSPREWQRVRQEILAQPGFYDRMLGGVITSDDLAKKIEDQLRLVMGPHAASQEKKPLALPMHLSGDPSDPTDIQTGAAQYGHDVPEEPKKRGPEAGAPAHRLSSPQPESPEARRRRVAAQDMQMMGAGSKSALDRMTRSGKTKVGG